MKIRFLIWNTFIGQFVYPVGGEVMGRYIVVNIVFRDGVLVYKIIIPFILNCKSIFEDDGGVVN